MNSIVQKLKKMKFLFISLLLSVLFVSCDPTASVDFNVRNESDKSILVVLASDTSIIETGTEKTIYDEFHIGTSTIDYMGDLVVLPFDTLLILRDSGEVYNKDALDISRWEKSTPKEKSGLGKLTLGVVAGDFD